MNNINLNLLHLSKTFKNNTPKQDELYVARQNNTQFCFFSRGCRFSEQGLCLMCNYGKGGCVIDKKRLKKALDQIFSNHSQHEEIPMMLFGTNGSIFDEYEMPNDCFEYLLNYISKFKIKCVYFETFYTSVTEEKLKIIKQKLKHSNVFIEMGFESASKDIREKILLKFIDNDLFKEKVELIHKFNFFATVNVLLGIPFLTMKETIQDTLNSIHFLVKNAKADEIIVFPLNIKINTLLEKIDCDSTYLLSIFEIIKNLKNDELEKVGFAWFDETNKNPFIAKAPKSCDVCWNYVVQQVKEFNKSNKKQKITIRDNLKNTNCKCEKDFIQALNYKSRLNLDERISKALKKIQKMEGAKK